MQTKKKPINLLQNIVYKMKKTKENVCVFIQNAKDMMHSSYKYICTVMCALLISAAMIDLQLNRRNVISHCTKTPNPFQLAKHILNFGRLIDSDRDLLR